MSVPEVVTVRIDSSLQRQLRAQAAREDRSVSAVVRLAVRDYLRHHSEVSP